MKKLRALMPFLVLSVILLTAGVAAMSSVLPQPAQPTVVATANAGELGATWSATAGAQFYTVGWADLAEVYQMDDAGRDWRDAFHFVTVPSAYTSHTITGIKPSTEYAVIVGARTTRLGGSVPVWSAWTFATTSGQHGAGFCPITGLQIPTEGYLSVGDTRTWTNGALTLDSATLPASVSQLGRPDYVPPDDRKVLLLCTTRSNQIGSDWYFQTGTHNNLSTDRGIGFAKVTGWGSTPLADGETASACDAWSIPESATVAVYAVDDGSRPNVLYRIDLSTIPASSTSTSSGTTAPSAEATGISQRHIDEKRYMLQLINAERVSAGVGTVTLGNNIAAQLHAESALENCFSSHWGLDGLKPYMRYSLAGGVQSNGENVSGLDYCVKATDGYASISSVQQEIREAMDGWMNSAGHRRNLLDPQHRKVNIGLAWDRYNTNMIQHFEGDYVEYTQQPAIANGLLSFTGNTRNGTQLSENLGQSIRYDPSPHGLTVGQVARTYCYDNGRTVAALRPPLPSGYRYPTDEFSATYSPCPSPYDVPADTPAPGSPAEAHQAWQEAYDASQSRVPQPITVPWITASEWTSTGTAFSIRADISGILNQYGHGVYSITLWGEVDGTATVVSQFSIFHGVTPPDTYSYALA